MFVLTYVNVRQALFILLLIDYVVRVFVYTATDLKGNEAVVRRYINLKY